MDKADAAKVARRGWNGACCLFYLFALLDFKAYSLDFRLADAQKRSLGAGAQHVLQGSSPSPCRRGIQRLQHAVPQGAGHNRMHALAEVHAIV